MSKVVNSPALVLDPFIGPDVSNDFTAHSTAAARTKESPIRSAPPAIERIFAACLILELN